MTNQSIALLICIFFIALALSYYQYIFLPKKRSKINLWFFMLRFFTYFGIGVLLLNPKIESTSTEIEKRNLVILADNSASIQHLGDTILVNKVTDNIQQDQALNDKFNLEIFKFGTNIEPFSQLNFSSQQTNIAKAFTSIEEIFDLQKDVVVFLSDGNQTLGADFSFWASIKKLNFFPIVIGDTLPVIDSKIDLVNANKYSFFNNTFPIEAFVSYNVEENLNTKLKLFQNNRLLATKNILFTPDKASQQIEFKVKANQIGLQNFSLRLSPLKDEKFTENNSFQLGVEIIDESAKILIATSILHPDIAMLKRSIESNPQRKVDVKLVGENPIDIDKYEMLIYYQPKANFKSLMQQVAKKQMGSLLITGTKTDYNFLNKEFDFFTKEKSAVIEDFFPLLNNNFNSFQVENLEFQSYPPIRDQFGTVSLNTPFQTLLFQKVQGIQTNSPMLLTYSNHKVKSAMLLGENAWRWRSESYLNTGDFKTFDAFISSLVQYVSNNNTKERLLVSASNFLYEGEANQITAKFYDANYRFLADANLSIQIKKLDDEDWQEFPMLLLNNEFSYNTEALSAGNYEYTITEKDTKIQKSGKFSIISYNAEKQFISPNLDALKTLHKNNKLYTLNEAELLKKDLLNNTKFNPIQKSILKNESLIDRILLFVFLALTLFLEWFLRKYKGLI